MKSKTHCARTLAILGYNLAHALLTAGVPRGAGFAALVRGARDHARGRYGPGRAENSKRQNPPARPPSRPRLK